MSRGNGKVEGEGWPGHEDLFILSTPELKKNSDQEVVSLALRFGKIILASPKRRD